MSDVEWSLLIDDVRDMDVDLIARTSAAGIEVLTSFDIDIQ